MHKIWLITKREYLTRVKSKTFLLTTLLAPLGILLFIIVAGFIFSRGSDEKRTIAIYDPSGLLNNEIQNQKNIEFKIEDRDLEALFAAYMDGKYDGILELPPIEDVTKRAYRVKFHSDNRLALDETFTIEDRIRNKIRTYKIDALELDREKLESLRTSVSIDPFTIREKDKKVSSISTMVGSALGGGLSYVLFFLILLYGAQVMRSVMEEKINRVVEVLISSVKPFQLMMGKIIGVGSVGLTQVAIWILLIPIIFSIGGLFFDMNPTDLSSAVNVAGAEAQVSISENQQKIFQVLQELKSMNWLQMIPLIIIYFFGGFFAYAALFAAVGSAVGEDINEAQSLTLPIMLPLILAIYIAFSAVNAPNSSLAIWSSMIPLLSSIVMPVRLPMDPPFWQIAVSVILLIGSVLFLVWVAARIYRTGILMYGKKASIKELAKWIFYKS